MRLRSVQRAEKAIAEALSWYADPANWRRRAKRDGNCKLGWHDPAASIDKGSRARFVLAIIDDAASRRKRKGGR